MKLNWKPVIASLLKVLQDHRFELVSVDDGGDTWNLTGTPRTRRQQAKRAIDAVDQSSLYVTHPDVTKQIWIGIALGNSPEETVYDYSVVTETPILEIALEQFTKKWAGKPCPTI